MFENINSKLFKSKETDDKGFTLIELMTWVVIVAIIALLAVPRFTRYSKNAKLTAMETDTKVIGDAAEMQHIYDSKWPVTENSKYGVGGTVKLYEIDESALEDSIRKTNRDYSDYGIATEGEYEGQVFHVNGMKDEKGVLNYGNGLKINLPPYKDDYIDKLIDEEGYVPIASSAELDNIRNNQMQTFGEKTKWEGEYVSGLDGKYIQVSDIDLSENNNFEPIGRKDSTFRGIFDGGGHSIENITIDRPKENFIGLFGRADEAVFKNIGIKNASIKGNGAVGSLVGKQYQTEVLNTYATGDVTALNKDVGGLVGRQNESMVVNSYSIGNVEGAGVVGGLIGFQRNDSRVSDSYAIGKVTGDERVIGGLVGLQADSLVTSSYYNNDGVAEVQLYNNEESDDAKGVGKPSAELKVQSTFKDWDFDNIWELDSNGYPTLRR